MEIRNGENEINQGMESSLHYPSKKKYVMFTYVMRLSYEISHQENFI